MGRLIFGLGGAFFFAAGFFAAGFFRVCAETGLESNATMTITSAVSQNFSTDLDTSGASRNAVEKQSGK